jgi:hypothetical protein
VTAEHAPAPAPRFCDQCGRSLIPLDVPHVKRPCGECPNAVYVVERGEDGQGIRIREGDQFSIPAGWLTISLDPSKSRGRLTRHGIGWLASTLLVGDLPSEPKELGALLDRYAEEAEGLLRASDKLAHLDLDTEDGWRETIELLKDDREAAEWWALLMLHSASGVREELPTGEPDAAALSAVRMQAARSMAMFKQQLESYVWTGYRHTRLIYDVAAAGASTPQEAEKIQALRPLFSKLDEDVLHAWVESNADIGPKIGVSQVDEELLKALARFHLDAFERRRRDEQLEIENKARSRDLTIKGFSLGVTAASTVLVALGLVLKYFEVF